MIKVANKLPILANKFLKQSNASEKKLDTFSVSFVIL